MNQPCQMLVNSPYHQPSPYAYNSAYAPYYQNSPVQPPVPPPPPPVYHPEQFNSLYLRPPPGKEAPRSFTLYMSIEKVSTLNATPINRPSHHHHRQCSNGARSQVTRLTYSIFNQTTTTRATNLRQAPTRSWRWRAYSGILRIVRFPIRRVPLPWSIEYVRKCFAP